jgi:hypothetical protein
LIRFSEKLITNGIGPQKHCRLLLRVEEELATYYGSAVGGYFPEIQSELQSGESLLWSGQPLKRILFHQRDLFSIPFSLLWGGFAIFWEWGATGHFGRANHGATTFFFALWGIPFVLMGQYMIWGRFMYIAWRKGRTFYAVTNKRVLIVTTGFSRKVIDAYFRSIDSVSLSTRPDGVGTVEFSPNIAPSLRSRFGNRGNHQLDIDLSSLAFYDIDDARNVYQQIQLQRDQTSRLDSNKG